MNWDNFNKLRQTYAIKLAECVREFPDQYGWPEDQVYKVADKMMDAVKNHGIGEVNINSHAFKRTCKEIGINCTYKAIKEYLA